MTLAESEKQKWRDAVTELERQRDARAAETREERAVAERDAETRVRAPRRWRRSSRPRTRGSLARTRKRSV